MPGRCNIETYKKIGTLEQRWLCKRCFEEEYGKEPDRRYTVSSRSHHCRKCGRRKEKPEKDRRMGRWQNK